MCLAGCHAHASRLGADTEPKQEPDAQAPGGYQPQAEQRRLRSLWDHWPTEAGGPDRGRTRSPGLSVPRARLVKAQAPAVGTRPYRPVHGAPWDVARLVVGVD